MGSASATMVLATVTDYTWGKIALDHSALIDAVTMVTAWRACVCAGQVSQVRTVVQRKVAAQGQHAQAMATARDQKAEIANAMLVGADSTVRSLDALMIALVMEHAN